MMKIKTKRTFLWLGMLAVLLSLCGMIWRTDRAEAASPKISSTLENGTLTIQGKGALKFRDVAVTSQKKINQVKKIVVKKGITSIPEKAFRKFKKAKEVEIAGTVKKIGDLALPDTEYLEKVTIPGTFELATYGWNEWKEQSKYQDWGEWWEYEQLLDDKMKIDTICFNTKLSLKTLSWVQSKNLIVSDSDPNYKSVDGVIYSRDGKSLVRVPSERESLTVEAGCEEFCLSSVLYAKQDGHSEIQANCENLKLLVLPASIKKVDTKKYAAFQNGRIHLSGLVINTEQLDSESVFALTQGFSNLKEEYIYDQLDSVSLQDGMYINANDACIIRYKENASEVTIPEGIQKIGERAFYKGKIKKVIMPDTVTKMNPGVFEECSELSQVTLSKNITKIPDNTFADCRKIKEIVIPDGVTTIGKDAFYGCKSIKELAIPDGVTTIDNGAFTSMNCKEMILPATVKKIGKYAFGRKLEKVIICGKATGFDAKAFYNCDKTVLHFRTGIKEWKTWPHVTAMGGARMWNSIEFYWQKISGVDGWQIQVSHKKSFQKKQTYDAGKKKRKMDIDNNKINMRYVRIRPYQKKGGKKVYGKWSVTKI